MGHQELVIRDDWTVFCGFEGKIIYYKKALIEFDYSKYYTIDKIHVFLPSYYKLSLFDLMSSIFFSI